MSVFTGTHINKIDKKGRVSVPAPFRSALAKEGATGVAVFPSYSFPAIEGCGPGLIEQLAAGAFLDYNLFSPGQAGLATHIFGIIQQLDWDSEGRVLLPQPLAARFGIGEQAVFVGNGRFFQIWEPAAHAKHEAERTQQIHKSPPRLILRPPERQ